MSGDLAPSVVEYKSVAPKVSGSAGTAGTAGTGGPAISFVDFSSSRTDYSRLAKAGPE